MLKHHQKYLNWYILINAILILIACRGIYVSFFMNGVNRSLWLDEAFLASSFSKRSFFGILLEGEFEYLQSAPLGWLWIEKLLAILFGNTPYVLRMGSVVSFILILFLLTFIQRYYYHSTFPFAAAAFLSNIPIILQYSNMFKPYITDGLVSLLITVVYGLWKKRKLGIKWLAVIWMCLIWFSQTACFMIGGFGLCELIFSCMHKDKKGIRNTLLLGAAVGVSFCIYYILWVRRMTSITDMQNYWTSSFFPLIPTSIADLKNGISLLWQIFGQYHDAALFVMAFTIGGLLLSVWKKDRIIIGLFLGIAIALFASYIHMYPVNGRLWCFSNPVIALIVLVTVEEIAQRKDQMKAIVGLVMVIVSASNTGQTTYSEATNVYWDRQELQLEMDYLRDHMKPEELVYVYSLSRPGFEYINGYENRSFGAGHNNVIFGEADFDWRFEFDYKAEAEKVIANPKIWIVSSHTESTEHQFPQFMDALRNAMHGNGYLELISYQYETPLWYYSESLDDVKKHFTMSVQSLKNDDGWNEAVIHIKNDGEAYLNNPYDEIFLVEKKSGDIYPIDGLIAPGAEQDITVRFSDSEEPEYSLRSQFGKIAEDDSINITREMIGRLK